MYALTLGTLGKMFSIFQQFSFFSQNTEILFSEKNKKITSLLSAEITQRVVKVESFAEVKT